MARIDSPQLQALAFMGLVCPSLLPLLGCFEIASLSSANAQEQVFMMSRSQSGDLYSIHVYTQQKREGYFNLTEVISVVAE